jgi:hypothetical protein
MHALAASPNDGLFDGLVSLAGPGLHPVERASEFV